MMQNPLVSIVILAYNGEEIIADCLDSALNQNYDNIEIIIVDNASTDGTLELLKKLQASSFKLQVVSNKKNIGFAGHNVGLEASSGEFILCMNQDVILDRNFVTEAVRVFEQDEKIGAVQSKLKNKNEKFKIDTTGIVAFKSRRFTDRGQGEEDKGQYEKTEEVFGVNGAAAFFRKKCLESISIKLPANGGPSSVYCEYYDSDFFMYKEDVDLSWRIRLYGWKIMYCPKAIAYTNRTSKLISERGGVAQIIKIRRRQKQYVQYLSFKNHRLAIIKNELPWLFLKHLPWILPREIGAWLYVLFFEPKTWPAIGELFRQMPRAWKKRRLIMQKRKAGTREMEKWFR